jgi:radical SAM superfamily enzyme YgiQ (UPF0313 family)
MTIKKIALVEPASAGLHIYSRAGLPRLGTVLLGTIARDLGYDVDIQVEEINPIERSRLFAADLVGISTITTTAIKSYALADDLRAAGRIVVMGGPHVTWQVDEALEHCDYVIRGEGEEGFPALLEALGDETPELASIAGLSWLQDGVRKDNPLATPVDLDTLPLPDLDLAGYGKNRAMGPRRVVPVQTSRGCPYTCTFCTVHTTFGRRMRYRSIDKVMDDLVRMDGSDIHVFFYDDNFVVGPRRCKELCERMIAADLKLRYSAQVRADIGKDAELLRLLKASGCMGVYIGLESVNEATLKAANKKQTVEGMRRDIRAIRKAGISIHGMFVLGFDEDDATTVDDTIRFATECGITSVQFMILTPLPGSETFATLEEQGRLRTKDWSLYDCHHVVFAPKNLSPLQLQQGQIQGHARFYCGRRILKYASRGDLLNSAVAVYAWKLNRDWQKSKRGYMRALERIDGTDSPALWETAFDQATVHTGVASRRYHRAAS